jgi:hypothetical protein
MHDFPVGAKKKEERSRWVQRRKKKDGQRNRRDSLSVAAALLLCSLRNHRVTKPRTVRLAKQVCDAARTILRIS